MSARERSAPLINICGFIQLQETLSKTHISFMLFVDLVERIIFECITTNKLWGMYFSLECDNFEFIWKVLEFRIKLKTFSTGFEPVIIRLINICLKFYNFLAILGNYKKREVKKNLRKLIGKIYSTKILIRTQWEILK